MTKGEKNEARKKKAHNAMRKSFVAALRRGNPSDVAYEMSIGVGMKSLAKQEGHKRTEFQKHGGKGELTSLQTDVLSVVGSDPIRTNDIVARIGGKMPSINGALMSLENRGAVERCGRVGLNYLWRRKAG